MTVVVELPALLNFRVLVVNKKNPYYYASQMYRASKLSEGET